MPPATPTGFSSSLSGLPDQVLLAHTRSLVLHEQALQLAVLDHLREIQARHLHLRLGFSSLFDYLLNDLISFIINILRLVASFRYHYSDHCTCGEPPTGFVWWCIGWGATEDVETKGGV